MGRYLQVRFWSQYTIKFNHKTCDSDEKYIGEVAQTFYTSGDLSEESIDGAPGIGPQRLENHISGMKSWIS